MVAESVEALQALVGTIASVDATSGSIGQAIVEQECLATRVSTNLKSMRDAVFTLSREIREAAQIASNSGMLSEIVLETANSVDGHMSALKTKLENIGAHGAGSLTTHCGKSGSLVRPRSADSLLSLSAELRECAAPLHGQIEALLRLPGAIRISDD
jgi:hypothetical protein